VTLECPQEEKEKKEVKEGMKGSQWNKKKGNLSLKALHDTSFSSNASMNF